jgi:hypothetical protein
MLLNLEEGRGNVYNYDASGRIKRVGFMNTTVSLEQGGGLQDFTIRCTYS